MRPNESGTFLPFLLDFSQLNDVEQAQAILGQARDAIATGQKGAAITYSANGHQTRAIASAYDAGQWRTRIAGANQASVMMAMEDLLEGDAADLRGHARIAPITTMTYPVGVEPLDMVQADLARIEKLVDDGWRVLGWQNQVTWGSDRPYAIGGGIAGSLPESVSHLIQQTLADWASAYAPETG